MSTYLLIDGHSQAFRAFFGVRAPLVTSRGESTGAVFGFVSKLFSVLREYRPEGVAVAFDKGGTWRHEEFGEYKATREAMPDEMRPQMDRIEQLLEAFHIPIITAENYEADDVLGALAQQAATRGHDVLILSGDRDMFQLVSDRIRILYTSGGPSPSTSAYGVKEVAERYGGLDPRQYLEMKALVGDSSDNIPGAPGVGEKTAIRYLTQYGSLDRLYASIDEIRGPKTQRNLRDAEGDVRRNKRLMTIVCDLDVAFDADAFRFGNYDSAAIRSIFAELEFRTLRREFDRLEEAFAPNESNQAAGGEPGSQAQLLPGDLGAGAAALPPPIAAPAEPHPYQCIQSEEDLERLVESLTEAKILSFDVETTGTDPMSADLVGLGVAWTRGAGCYIPVAHKEGVQLPWPRVRAAMARFFADPRLPKVAHNGKYDLVVCRRHGLEIEGPIHDTMTVAWLLDSASHSLGLKSLAQEKLGWTMTDIDVLIGSGRKQITIDQVDIGAGHRLLRGGRGRNLAVV